MYRNRLLRELREQDEAEFVKVLDDLHISYQTPKQPEHVKTRKAWSEHLLRRRVDAEKERRMDEFRRSLEENREAKLAQFDADRARVLKSKDEALRALDECRRVQSRVPPNVQGKYEPRLVEEQYEFDNHQSLFYFPKPAHKAA